MAICFSDFIRAEFLDGSAGKKTKRGMGEIMGYLKVKQDKLVLA